MQSNSMLCRIALMSALLLIANQNLQARIPFQTQDDLPTTRVATGTKYLRMIKDSSGVPQSLETSVTRFRSKDGSLLVDLIAVIHIGEARYYRKLNHQFTQYESLLYELVAPPESQVPDRRNLETGDNPLRWLQGSMQRLLGLESQLQHIDYSRSNFVHADLSPAQMKRKMSERGHTAWTVGLKAITEIMKQQEQAPRNGSAIQGSEINDFEELMEVITNPSRLKIMLASQFASGNLDAGLGDTLNQLLITDRNEAAIEVLKQQIEDGKTRIGIFYGAAHMPDFEKRLTDQLGLHKTKQAWVRAWDLRAKRNAASPAGTLSEMFFEILQDLAK